MPAFFIVKAKAVIIKNEQILLIEYSEKNCFHYNLPGGKVEIGETIDEALQRELEEEASVYISIGNIICVYEYTPHKHIEGHASDIPTIQIILEAHLKENQIPKLPQSPDKFQTAVKWVPLADLDTIVLYPNLKSQIKQYYKQKQVIELAQDFKLPNQKSLET
jgi:8-oxo-dGTP diphosphatase